MLQDEDQYWMEFALREAEQAYLEGEIPVGAVIVQNRRIIGKGHNQREKLRDPTAHAEIMAITAAAATLNSWRLNDCILYVTLEPCPMCAGAILNARIPRIVFGCYDFKAGMCGSIENLCDQNLLNHRAVVKGGVAEQSCQALLDDFFRQTRLKNEESL